MAGGSAGGPALIGTFRAEAALVVITLGIGGCSVPARHPHLAMHVDPAQVAFDQPLTLTVTGAVPGRTVRIAATATDAAGVRWESHADA